MIKRLEVQGRVTRGTFALEIDAAFDLDGILAVFGPSGSGKTTFLRLVAGLAPDAHCRVTFENIVWQDARRCMPAFKRRIGYVFQDGRLFSHLDVRRNLEYSMRFRPDATPDRFETVIAALELGPLIDRAVTSLSGGEAQRVALGRALIANPQLLLMDEPLSSLDLERKREIIDYIARLPAQFGVPVTRLARTTALLDEGRIVAHGPTSRVFVSAAGRPIFGRDEASSILLAKVEKQSGALTSVSVGTQTLKLPNIKAAVGTDIQVRIRARDVVIATHPVNHVSIRNMLACRLLDVRDHDALQAELLLEVEGQSLRALVTREAVTDLDLTAGSPVYALIKSIAFDAAL